MPPWVIALVSSLLAAVGALVLLLLGVIVQEIRDATRERLHIERALYEHMADQHTHRPQARPVYPPEYRPP